MHCQNGNRFAQSEINLAKADTEKKRKHGRQQKKYIELVANISARILTRQ